MCAGSILYAASVQIISRGNGSAESSLRKIILFLCRSLCLFCSYTTACGAHPFAAILRQC